MKLKMKLKLIGCGLMIAFASVWTIGPLKPIRNAIIAPGSGACGKCQMPWRFTDHHSTSYGTPINIDDDPNITVTGGIVFGQVQYGMFVLCERCWTKLTPAERLPYYRESYDRHKSERDWEAIKAAVLAGG